MKYDAYYNTNFKIGKIELNFINTFDKQNFHLYIVKNNTTVICL